MWMLKWILDWLLKDTEEELYSQYKTDIIDCHPGRGLPPITFEQFKAYPNSIDSFDADKTTQKMLNNQPDIGLEEYALTPE